MKCSLQCRIATLINFTASNIGQIVTFKCNSLYESIKKLKPQSAEDVSPPRF